MEPRKKTHLIGIKGTGMSALAALLQDRGHEVIGSDIDQPVFTEPALRARRIPILSFRPTNVRGADEVIHSASFLDDHPEIVEAKSLGLPTYSYPQYVGKLTKTLPTIAVSGAHGKTTTTAMLVHVWKAADRSPSYIIGDGTGAGGEGDFILEACEYRRHFLEYAPEDALLLNIDFDHPDYFADLEDTIDAFAAFAAATKRLVVGFGDDPNVRRALASVGPSPRVIHYGLAENNDYRAVDVASDPQGQRYTLIQRGRPLGEIQLAVPGAHNVLNSLGVAAAALERGLPYSSVQRGLAAFQGTHRRFEVIRVGPGILVDDYAHHPAEIAATIQSARERFPDRRVVAAFQPHTYTRTKALQRDFAAALDQADAVWLMDIFGSAREKNGEISSADLLRSIDAESRLVDFDELADAGKRVLAEGAVLLLMGAGDIYNARERLQVP